MKDFLTCIESRGKPVADIEQGYISATACILANLSMSLGRSLEWDHAAGQVVRRRRKPTSCCGGRIARRGCTRIRRESEQSTTKQDEREVSGFWLFSPVLPYSCF